MTVIVQRREDVEPEQRILHLAYFEEAKPIGYARVNLLCDGSASIGWFNISAKKRGRGFGGKFYGETERLLKENGVEQVRLVSSSAAEGFWRRMGFYMESRMDLPEYAKHL